MAKHTYKVPVTGILVPYKATGFLLPCYERRHNGYRDQLPEAVTKKIYLSNYPLHFGYQIQNGVLDSKVTIRIDPTEPERQGLVWKFPIIQMKLFTCKY